MCTGVRKSCLRLTSMCWNVILRQIWWPRKGCTPRKNWAMSLKYTILFLRSKYGNYYSNKYGNTYGYYWRLDFLDSGKSLLHVFIFAVFVVSVPQLCDHKTNCVCLHRCRNGFSPDKKGSYSITQLLSRPKVSKSYCVISQQPLLYSVRTLSSMFLTQITMRTRLVFHFFL